MFRVYIDPPNLVFCLYSAMLFLSRTYTKIYNDIDLNSKTRLNEELKKFLKKEMTKFLNIKNIPECSKNKLVKRIRLYWALVYQNSSCLF